MLSSVRYSLYVFTLFLAVILLVRPPAVAQQAAIQPDRIAESADLTSRVALPGQLPAWVNPSRDAGPAPADAQVGLTFVLARAPAQQAAFDQLLAAQQDPSSPFFHHWLTPRQIGEQFGPTPHDVDRIVAWLRTSGFQVQSVAPSRLFVHAYAPAAVAASALSTSFRLFMSLGKARLSATTDPVIPAAFASVISSISGLTSSELQPQHHAEAFVRPSIASGPSPQFTNAAGLHYVFPKDFATIFDLNPLYNAGIDGTGQRVAIIGRSRINLADMTAYENQAALPTNLPNTYVASPGIDPGVVFADEGEADLDLQRVIGVAPGVTADLVISGQVNGFDGIYLAAQYEVQTLRDPVLSLSYGSCERDGGSYPVAVWSSLFAQAAAEGISVFVSSGDAGAAFCDPAFTTPPASQVRSINYICANPSATCVGGTELAEPAGSTSFWSPTNGIGFSSALQYIPEGGWNDPSTTNASGQTSYFARASTGGVSLYATKPLFQVGTGVPADGFRDVPDVSFPASGHDGYFGCQADTSTFNGDCSNNGGVVFSGTSTATPGWAGVAVLLNQKAGASQGNFNPIIYRLAANPANGVFHDVTPASTGLASCDVNVPSLCNNSVPAPNSLTGGLVGYPVQTGYDQVTGWGSADIAHFVTAALLPYQSTTLALTASPATISTAQTVVFTATLTSTAAAGTGPAAPPSGTVQFYSNGTPIGSPVTLVGGTTAQTSPQTYSTPGTYQITAAYSGDAIYTGTSSAVYLLIVTAPGKVASAVTLTASRSTASTQQPVSFTAGIASTGSVPPTGSVQFMNGSSPLGAAIPVSAAAATLPAMTFPAGTYNVTALYSGDAVYASATSNGVSLIVTAVPTSSLLTATANSSTTLTPIGFTDTISGSGGTPTGSAQLLIDGNPRGAAVSVLNGTATFAPGLYIVGTHLYSAGFSGDTVFAASTSNSISITLTAPASMSSLTLTPTTILPSGTVVAAVAVSGTPGAAAPSGTVSLVANGVSFGSTTLANGSASLRFTGPGTPGTYLFTVVYSGDSIYAGSSSAQIPLLVTAGASGITIVSNPAALVLAAGAVSGNTTALTYTVSGPGPIASSCTITSTGPAASIPPTCSATAVTLSASGIATGTLTVTTLAPHSIFAASPRDSAPANPIRTTISYGTSLACLIFLFRRRRLSSRRAHLRLLLLLVAFTGLITAGGCGSGIHSNPLTGGTTPGSYLITVSATSGSASGSASVPLTIQ